MRKLSFVFVTALFSAQCFAQNSFPGSGTVAIGTTSPAPGILVAQGLVTSQTSTSLNPGSNDAFNLFAGGNGYNDGARQTILWSQAGLLLGRFGTEYNAARGQIDFVWRDQYNYGPTSNEAMRLTGAGKLGIGTATPLEPLTIGNETPGSGRNVLRLGAASYAEPAPINTSSNGDKIILYDATVSNYDARIGVGDRANFWMKSFSNSGSIYGSFEWYSGSNSGTPQMVLSGLGNLSIGTYDSQGYKLAVKGNIHAQQVNVDLNNWSDYVFNDDYVLKPLNEVKTYIDKNHHLPEIPSAAEVVKNGVNLGDMDKLLVKKIEELTLYLIEKDKTEKIQNERILKLEKQLKSLTRKKQPKP